MSDTQAGDPGALALTEQIDNLLKEADHISAQTAKIFDDLGIDRDAPRRYLESDRAPAAEREKARKEIEDFKAEIERDVLDAQERARQSNAASHAPRMASGRMRV